MPQNQNSQGGLAASKHQAAMLCQQGAFTEARALLEPFRTSNNLDADGWFMLGSIDGQFGDFNAAVQCYQNAIDLDPDNIGARMGLVKAQSRLGRAADTEASLHALLAVKPDHIAAIQELGTLLIAWNRLEEAADQFKRILDIEPDSVDALFNLGRVYHMLRKPELAKGYLDSAIRIAPQHANAHHLLGYQLLGRGQTDEAAEHLNKALAINPQHVQARKDLGYLYLSTNRPDKARKELDAAIALQPDNLETNIVLAKLFDQQGDVQAAYELVAPHIDRGTLHADLGIVFASLCRHFDRCEEAAAYIEKVIELSERGSARNEPLYFALGKLYDRLGNYDKAFENFEKGNLKRTDEFNAIEDAGCIDRLIKTCDWNFFVSAPRSSQTTDSPVFIVGMPRSGTTLVEQILASHPDVEAAGEVAVIPSIIRNLSSVLGAGTAYPDNLKNLTTGKLDILANQYRDGMRKLAVSDAPRVTDKTLVNYMYLGLISRMFPKARVVHCMRDPRDTCLSIFFQNFDESHYYANQLENLGAYYSLYRKIMRHWESLCIMPIFNIQYEDLVQNQEARSRELIEFLGLEWNDKVLKFYETKRSVATASYDQVRQKMYSKSMQRWKNYERHIDPLVSALTATGDWKP